MASSTGRAGAHERVIWVGRGAYPAKLTAYWVSWIVASVEKFERLLAITSFWEIV
jgi:hypothetical protein